MVKMQTKDLANEIRKHTARWAIRANGGYLAQACGSAEILATLFNDVLDLGKSTGPFMPSEFIGVPKPGSPGTRGESWLGNGPDLLVISPAHYATAMYSALVATGRMDEEALIKCSKDGQLLEMIGAEHSPGMVVSSGSLATALSVCVGRAIARQKLKKPGFIWVFLSDGELQEGATWEALQLAKAMKLSNLKIVIDNNGMQVDGQMNNVMPIGAIEDKLRAFGCEVYDIDGHNLEEINLACKSALQDDSLSVILARTKPWTGFSFLLDRWENNKLHFIRLTEIEKEILTKELAAL
jgi:transketolase